MNLRLFPVEIGDTFIDLDGATRRVTNIVHQRRFDCTIPDIWLNYRLLNGDGHRDKIVCRVPISQFVEQVVRREIRNDDGR